ncbi:MAG: pyruvate kinase [Rickettsiales bacterium]|nr:pyruvate kinase [Rickettsiales bacterium]
MSVVQMIDMNDSANHPKLSLAPRRCKIIATVGPATNLLQLINAGATAFRLNFSHGSHEDHLKQIHAIREVEKETGQYIPILADMQGPKIRVGTFADGPIELKYGTEVTLEVSKEPGKSGLIRLPHPEILEALQVGDELKLDDGTMALTLTAKESNQRATARVDIPGMLSDKKGVNVPTRQLPISALTQKDRTDLDFVLQHGVDIIALSFVQTAEDVAEAKKIIGDKALVLSKIEKPLAMDGIEAIVELSDMIMVARGDLGVELPMEQVPAAQRKIVTACRKAGKPVVVATQMLQSMVDTPVPTRAETSDVATAVYLGVDAVMLSAESAVGRHPATAVAVMDRIIRAVEGDDSYWDELYDKRKIPIANPLHALAASARDITRLVQSKATLAFTRSGGTAFACARDRARCPVFGVTPQPKVARQLALVWGVTSVLSPDFKAVEEIYAWTNDFAKRALSLEPADEIVTLSGEPVGVPGTTNTLRIMTVK